MDGRRKKNYFINKGTYSPFQVFYFNFFVFDLIFERNVFLVWLLQFFSDFHVRFVQSHILVRFGQRRRRRRRRRWRIARSHRRSFSIRVKWASGYRSDADRVAVDLSRSTRAENANRFVTLVQSVVHFLNETKWRRKVDKNVQNHLLLKICFLFNEYKE